MTEEEKSGIVHEVIETIKGQEKLMALSSKIVISILDLALGQNPLKSM